MKCYMLQVAVGLGEVTAFCAVVGLAVFLLWLIFGKGLGFFYKKLPEKTKNILENIGICLMFMAFASAFGMLVWMLGGELMPKLFHVCVGN